jgi:hypothetical protein
MNIDRYKEIAHLGSEFNQTNIVAYIPKPIDIDYNRGYITRYFIQKSNDPSSVIYEIRKKSTSKFSTNSFYNVVSLDWRIKGSPSEVKKSNSASVRIASQSMRNIQLYLPNLLQFHKK